MSETIALMDIKHEDSFNNDVIHPLNGQKYETERIRNVHRRTEFPGITDQTIFPEIEPDQQDILKERKYQQGQAKKKKREEIMHKQLKLDKKEAKEISLLPKSYREQISRLEEIAENPLSEYPVQSSLRIDDLDFLV